MKRFLLVVIGSVLSSLALAKPAGDVQKVIDCMRGNAVQRGGLRQLEIATTERDGSKESLQLNAYWRPDAAGTRISMQVTQPESLAGSAYLLREAKKGDDELFVYVPSIGKVRKIVGTAREENLWGTNFSYEEFKLIQGMALSSPTKKLADAVVGGRSSHVLESSLVVAGKPARKTVTYVDQKSCTVLKGELFNAAGKLVKVLEGDLSLLFETSDQKDKPVWLLLGYSMKDLERGSVSVVRLGEISLMEKARSSLFEPETFFKPATTGK